MNTASRTASNLVLRAADGTQYPLDEVSLLGRDAECQIVLADSKVSRYHARITVTDLNSVLVEDLHSTNGTFINGVRIAAPQTMVIGDELRLHKLSLRLTAIDSGDATIVAPVRNRAEAAPTPPPQPAAAPSPAISPSPAPTVLPADADATYVLKASELAKLQEIERKEVSVQRHQEVSGPCLVVLTAPIRGKVFALQAQTIVAHWTIGRGRDVDIQLIDRAVSKHHARIHKQGSRWRIDSLNATNKLVVNGTATESSALEAGDRIRLGRTELQFKIDHNAAAVAAASTTGDLPGKGFLIGALAFTAVATLLLLALAVFGK